MIELFDGAARVSGDPFLGLRIGSLMQTADYGPYLRFSLLPQERSAAVSIARFVACGISDRRRPCLELRGDEACFSYCQHVTSAQLARQHADHVLPAVIAFVRGFLGDRWQPATYEVPYGRHGGAGQLEAMLRGAVAFDGVASGSYSIARCWRFGSILGRPPTQPRWENSDTSSADHRLTVFVPPLRISWRLTAQRPG